MQNNDITNKISKSLSKEYNEKKEIVIYKISDILKSKIVAFTYDDNTKCGYAVLQLKKRNHYQLTEIKKCEDLVSRSYNIYNDLVFLLDDNVMTPFFVILNMNDQLSRIEFKTNSFVYTIKNQSTPSMIVINYSHVSGSEYFFIDKYGNEMN